MTNIEVTQSWPEASPEGALVRAFAAFAMRDGRALAALSSSASLQRYRDQVHAVAHPQWHEWTIEALRSYQPEMPVEAAEWRVRELAASRTTHLAGLLRQFADVTSLDELCALDAPELLTRALRMAPRGATDVPRLTVLGHVREGNAAHVLFRLPWRGPDGEIIPDDGTPKLATMTEEDGAWRLELEPHSRLGMPSYESVIYIGDHAQPPDSVDGQNGPNSTHPPAT